jgi:hypothetical protein
MTEIESIITSIKASDPNGLLSVFYQMLRKENIVLHTIR